MRETFVTLYIAIYLLGTFISSISQVLLKKAAQRQYDSALREYLNPLVIFAYCMFFGATLLTILAYKEVPLSMGAILEATGYIYIMIFGVIFFREKINTKKIIALTLILIGIVVYGISI